MCQHLLRLGKYSPDSPTFTNLFCSDSPDSPTFAKGHFWKKCDSPRHIRTSNERVTWIWGEWPLLKFFPNFYYRIDNVFKRNTKVHKIIIIKMNLPNRFCLLWVWQLLQIRMLRPAEDISFCVLAPEKESSCHDPRTLPWAPPCTLGIWCSGTSWKQLVDNWWFSEPENYFIVKLLLN